MMSDRVRGKRALVTGAAQGIGAAAAAALAGEGARVILSDRDGDAVQATAAALAAKGLDVTAMEHDVSSEASWAGVIAIAGPLDVLVNNAGVLLMKPLLDTSLDEFREVAAVNTDGVFLGIRHAFRAMGTRGGSIVNISSIAGLEGAAFHIAYCASKGAVRLMTKAAAVEAGALGLPIRVNSVHPGGIDTAMTQTTYGFGAGKGVEEAVAATTPTARIGMPDDIGAAVLFLASDESAFVNGTELVVDGGRTAGRMPRDGRPARH